MQHKVGIPQKGGNMSYPNDRDHDAPIGGDHGGESSREQSILDEDAALLVGSSHTWGGILVYAANWEI